MTEEERPTASEPVVIDGVVRTETRGALALVYGELTVGGVTRCRTTTDSVDVLRNDGRTVRVELDGDRTRVLPLETHRGRWGELARHAFADPFQSEAPDGAAKVTLRSAELPDGCRVCVHGEVLERADAGGRLVPTRVRADVVAWGADAADRIAQEVTSRPPRAAEPRVAALRGLTWVEAFVAVASLGWLVAALLLEQPAGRFESLVVACGLLLSALALRAARTDRWPFFYRAGAPLRAEGQVPRTPYLAILAALVTTGSLPLLGPGAASATAVAVPLAWAACVAFLAVSARRRTSAQAAAVRVLLDASPHEWPPRDGQWGATEGMVVGRGPIPILGVEAPVSAVVEEERVPGLATTEARQRTRAVPFVLRLERQRVEVDPTGATWATALRVWSGERPSAASPCVTVFADVVAEGMYARVVARMGVGGRLAKTRPDSLYVYAARDASLTPPLARILASRRETTVALGLAVVLLVALASFHPFW